MLTTSALLLWLKRRLVLFLQKSVSETIVFLNFPQKLDVHGLMANSQLAAIAAADPVCPLYTCIFWAGIILSATTSQLVSVRQGLL